jgi:hypothetical protein
MPTTPEIITEITSWFAGGFDIMKGILLPSAGMNPLSGLVWFGLGSGIISFAVGFIKKLGG